MRSTPATGGWQLVTLVTLFFVTTTALATPPSTSYIFPAGGQRGTSVNVIVGGHYLHGKCPFEMIGPGVQASKEIVLAERTIWFEGPLIPMPASQSGESYPKDQLGRVTVAADAPTGYRYYHASTSQGVTAERVFVVGHLPEVVEREIDGAPLPTAVKLPVTINGRIFPREDVDIWTFAGRAGTSYVCEVLASRIGSPLNSRLEIRGPDGGRIAENDDAHGSDSYLRFTAPVDGTFQVRIHDINFGGLQHFVYRLTITDGPWVEAIYPLGARRGATTRLHLLGQRLPADGIELAVPADAADRFRHSLKLDGAESNAFSIVVGDLPELVETEPNDTPATDKPVTLPVVLNGRIDKPGDIDAWVFEAKKDETHVLDLRAARLNTLLDGVITVSDTAGKQLARAEDAKGTSDPTLTFKVPADGRYVVAVSEQLAGRGGPRFAYRLSITPPDKKPEPGFGLTLTGNSLTLARGAEVKYKVNAQRRGGFNDAIALTVENLPAGVTVEASTIPAKKNVVELKFKAAADARVATARLKIVGKAKVGDAEQAATAVIPPGTIHDFERDTLLVGVAVPAPFKFTGDFQSRFVPRGSTYYRHFSLQRNGFKGPLVITLSDNQVRHLQGIHADPVTIPADQEKEFDYRIKLPPWLELGRTSRSQIMITGIVEDPDGTKHKVSYTSAAQFDQIIVLPAPGRIGIDTPRDSLVARPGGTVKVPIRITRATGAKTPVTVELVVPQHIRGVSAKPVSLPANADTGTLSVRFAAKGLGPFNMPLLLRATILDSRGHPLIGETPLEVVHE